MSSRKYTLADTDDAYICRILDVTCSNHTYGTLRGTSRKYSATRVPKCNVEVPPTVYEAVLMLMKQAGWLINLDYDRYYPCYRYL